jgi:hypothetical protein
MMDIEILVPHARTAPLEKVVSMLGASSTPCLPFSEPVIEFCAAFSQAIFQDREASRYPELSALAFWMRKAELVRMRDDFRQAARANTVAAPRGLVFHIPPSNVDTIFVYSWLLSALAGNRNLIRMSSSRAVQSDILLRLWRQVLPQASSEMQQNTVVVSYGHADEATRAFSLACDLRVIWGGDQTVSTIRSAPLAPHARDLTFPDRSSLCVIQSARYATLQEDARARLAEQFFNDAFWFDQMACSSPRTVIWCGDVETAGRSAKEFWASMTACAGRKHYESAASVHMRKLVFACESILDLPVSRYERQSEVTVLDLDSPDSLPADHCGGGLFFGARIDSLSGILPLLGRRHQTLTHFGFEAAELQELARQLAGKAIDRIVPIGKALQFHRFWDGYDLMHEFCRFTYLEAAE